MNPPNRPENCQKTAGSVRFWKVEHDYAMRITACFHPDGKVEFIEEDPLDTAVSRRFDPTAEELSFATELSRTNTRMKPVLFRPINIRLVGDN